METQDVKAPFAIRQAASAFKKQRAEYYKYLADLMDQGVLRRADPFVAAQQFKDLAISGVLQPRIWGVVTDEMRTRLPGLFKVDASGRMSSRDLFQTELARRSAPVQLSRFAGVNRDYLNKYAQGLTVKKQLETEIRRLRAQEAQTGDPKKWTD